MPQPRPHSPKKLDETKISQAAFQAFLNIAKKWDLNREQQTILLGHISPSDYLEWKGRAEISRPFLLPRDILERISYLLGIYEALHILLSTPDVANSWVKRPNAAPLFTQKSPIDKMLSGNIADLIEIRRYLDAQKE